MPGQRLRASFGTGQGIAQRDEQRARDQAERDRAAIDEPVSYAEADASLEATAAADKAEADTDADLEI